MDSISLTLYFIFIFNPFKNTSGELNIKPIYILKGHKNIIHDLDWSYNDKYLFTGTFRRDGSSKFLKHWGNFPSFSVGWNVHKEDFWKDNEIINTFKIRGGYGVLGNDAIDNFMFRSSLVAGSNYPDGTYPDTNIIIGYSPNTLGNPNLKWDAWSVG